MIATLSGLSTIETLGAVVILSLIVLVYRSSPTLGNLTVNPSVGLLFVDFETGRTLQLTGKAKIIWDGKRVREHDRAERLIEITVSEAIEAPDGNPLRWELEERSLFNP